MTVSIYRIVKQEIFDEQKILNYILYVFTFDTWCL